MRRHQILVLDGSTPALWLENILATTPAFSQPGMPSLSRPKPPEKLEGKGDGLPRSEGSRLSLVLEDVEVRDAHPSWAAFGFVHMPVGSVTVEDVKHRWLKTHPLLYQRMVAKQLAVFFPSLHKVMSL